MIENGKKIYKRNSTNWNWVGFVKLYLKFTINSQNMQTKFVLYSIKATFCKLHSPEKLDSIIH